MPLGCTLITISIQASLRQGQKEVEKKRTTKKHKKSSKKKKDDDSESGKAAKSAKTPKLKEKESDKDKDREKDKEKDKEKNKDKEREKKRDREKRKSKKSKKKLREPDRPAPLPPKESGKVNENDVAGSIEGGEDTIPSAQPTSQPSSQPSSPKDEESVEAVVTSSASAENLSEKEPVEIKTAENSKEQETVVENEGKSDETTGESAQLNDQETAKDHQPEQKPTSRTPAAASPSAEDLTARDEVISLYPFNAQSDKQLQLKKGDIVWVLRRDPSGWWAGEKEGKVCFLSRTIHDGSISFRSGCFLEIMCVNSQQKKKRPAFSRWCEESTFAASSNIFLPTLFFPFLLLSDAREG